MRSVLLRVLQRNRTMETYTIRMEHRMNSVVNEQVVYCEELAHIIVEVKKSTLCCLQAGDTGRLLV